MGLQSVHVSFLAVPQQGEGEGEGSEGQWSVVLIVYAVPIPSQVAFLRHSRKKWQLYSWPDQMLACVGLQHLLLIPASIQTPSYSLPSQLLFLD